MSGIHHTVIAVGDFGASLRFYRDGLGLDVLQDRKVEGDWPAPFDAPSRTLHALPGGKYEHSALGPQVDELPPLPDQVIYKIAAILHQHREEQSGSKC